MNNLNAKGIRQRFKSWYNIVNKICITYYTKLVPWSILNKCEIEIETFGGFDIKPLGIMSKMTGT